MATRHDIELTREQKDVLASIAEATGESVSSLIDEMFDALRERWRTTQVNGDQAKGCPPAQEEPKPIWEIFAETTDIPEEEWEKLPTDLASQHDHYIYGTPKRPL